MMKKILVLFILLIPFLSFAKDEQLDKLANKVIKELYKKYEPNCKGTTCDVTNVIISNLKNAYEFSQNNDDNLRQKAINELLEINNEEETLGDRLPMGEAVYYYMYLNTAYMLLNDTNYMRSIDKTSINIFYTDDDNANYFEDDIDMLNTHLSAYVLKAYAAYKYNISDYFKVTSKTFPAALKKYEKYLSKEDYNNYSSLYNKYKNKHNIVNTFFVSNYLKSNYKTYESLNTTEKIKRNLYDALFFEENISKIKERVNNINLNDLKSLKSDERIYYNNLISITKTALGDKQNINDAISNTKDLYLKLRMNALYLSSLSASNAAKNNIIDEYNKLSKLLEANKNTLISDYKNKKVSFDYYKIYKEYIDNMKGDL